MADEEWKEGSSQELEEKTGRAGPGKTWRPEEWPAQDALQALIALQLEVSSQHEVNLRDYLKFMCMNHLRWKRHLAGRITILQSIPGFWVKALSFLLLLGVCLSGRGGRGTGAGIRAWIGWQVVSGVGQAHRKGARGP